MKKYILPALALCVTLTSCLKVTRFDADAPAEDGITLTVSAIGLSTKADVQGEASYNENLISSVYYYIYSGEATDQNAVVIGHLDNLTAQGTERVRINVDENTLNNLVIPRPYISCKAYVVVNKPDGMTLPTGSSDDTRLATLRKLVANTNFTATEASAEGVQPSFLMEGSGTINLIDRNQKLAAQGTVEVNRLACKHTVGITVAPSITESDVVWTPVVNGIKIKFFNGVSNTALTGNFADNTDPVYFNYFTTGPDSGRDCPPIGSSEKYMAKPFYSYASVWKFDSVQEPYFTVVIPWTTEGRAEPRYCYYKVLMNQNHMDSNCWYHINLNVTVLGSGSESAAPVITDGTRYYVFDWLEALKPGEVIHDVEAAIKEARYIMVRPNTFDVDNVERLSIPFQSSHNCELTDITASHKVYDGTTFVDQEIDPAIVAGWLSLNGKVIEFTHMLDNNFGSYHLDTTPYEIHFKIRHTDDSDFCESIDIVQSPAIVVKSEANSSTDGRGNVYVNGQTQRIFAGTPYYYSVSELSGTHYMYVIQTKVLPDNSPYLLIDPRSKSANQISLPSIISPDPSPIAIFTGTDPEDHANPGIATAPYVGGGAGSTRVMMNYYATQTTEDSQKYISPKFRVASNFCSPGGVGPDVKYMDIVRRCATYQEDGYPAGRWRIPTKSELVMMAQLQKMNKIPQILPPTGSTNGYIYATGAMGIGSVEEGLPFFDIDAVSVVNNGHNVRCVYDDWLWEHEANGGRLEDASVFTWGDKTN